MIPHNIDCSKRRAGLNCTGLAACAKIAWMAKGVEPGIFERRGGRHLCSSDTHDVLDLRLAKYTGRIQVPCPVSVGRTERSEHVRAGKHFSLTSGGKFL
jgi:hypothetical protein